jgi:hypothetical protein
VDAVLVSDHLDRFAGDLVTHVNAFGTLQPDRSQPIIVVGPRLAGLGAGPLSLLREREPRRLLQRRDTHPELVIRQHPAPFLPKGEFGIGKQRAHDALLRTDINQPGPPVGAAGRHARRILRLHGAPPNAESGIGRIAGEAIHVDQVITKREHGAHGGVALCPLRSLSRRLGRRVPQRSEGGIRFTQLGEFAGQCGTLFGCKRRLDRDVDFPLRRQVCRGGLDPGEQLHHEVGDLALLLGTVLVPLAFDTGRLVVRNHVGNIEVFPENDCEPVVLRLSVSALCPRYRFQRLPYCSACRWRSRRRAEQEAQPVERLGIGVFLFYFAPLDRDCGARYDIVVRQV